MSTFSQYLQYSVLLFSSFQAMTTLCLNKKFTLFIFAITFLNVNQFK